MTTIPARSLEFVNPDPQAYIDAIGRAVREGARTVRIAPASVQAVSLTNIVRAQLPADVKVEGLAELPAIPWHDAVDTATVYALLPREKQDVSPMLLHFLDWRGGWLIAPETARFFAYSPLFLVSIPKAGTHLLYQLARKLGYRDGVELKDSAEPRHWYCLEYSNSHTAAPDFFIDSARRKPFGNRTHPFPHTPTLFIYRNPLDIWVSEANEYHKDAAILFRGYLSELPFSERLELLLNDPWLLGSVRDRVGKFLAWLEFPNVIPLSYEELVGAPGGGDDRIQEDLVWSIQLKLHTPGQPQQIGAGIVDPDSPAFHKGRIGNYRKVLPPRLFERFLRRDQDFMEKLGYVDSDLMHAPIRPARAEQFRRRPLRLSALNNDDTPSVIDESLSRSRAGETSTGAPPASR